MWVQPINIKRSEFGIFSNIAVSARGRREISWLFWNEHRIILPSVTTGGTGNMKTKHQL